MNTYTSQKVAHLLIELLISVIEMLKIRQHNKNMENITFCYIFVHLISFVE